MFEENIVELVHFSHFKATIKVAVWDYLIFACEEPHVHEVLNDFTLLVFLFNCFDKLQVNDFIEIFINNVGTSVVDPGHKLVANYINFHVLVKFQVARCQHVKVRLIFDVFVFACFHMVDVGCSVVVKSTVTDTVVTVLVFVVLRQVCALVELDIGIIP